MYRAAQIAHPVLVFMAVFDFFFQPSVVSSSGQKAEMTESEAVGTITKGHHSMMAVLQSRQNSLQVIRALWTNGNTKVRPSFPLEYIFCPLFHGWTFSVLLQNAIDCALGMRDQAVIVDLVNVMLQKS